MNRLVLLGLAACLLLWGAVVMTSDPGHDEPGIVPQLPNPLADATVVHSDLGTMGLSLAIGIPSAAT